MHHSNKGLEVNEGIHKTLGDALMKNRTGQINESKLGWKDFGATGKFPGGKLVEHDEGEILFGVAIKDNTVIINFGKSIKWIGMNKEQAKELGELLIKKSEGLVDL